MRRTSTGPRRAWFGQYPHVRPQDTSPSQFERLRGNGFAVPADALTTGTVTADLPPRMASATWRGR